ncbi:hypothetical protein TH53_16980 [Pedobacter lusitanus]|uniref:Uncharacterized protein n=1 Tax=Pedobacter lusitanus TaxID=1503925 RepID=A0A0D0GIT8_9SPHI|nr:hypothetical protein [Pedobacter lusitanus]KIO76030.1 hypothetical protein TH53_16980 [Pedobacter lusitanus]
MKLKQKIALGLCAFYLVSVIGVALSLHFCGGKLSGIHLTEVAHCGGCKEAEKPVKADDSCCKNTKVDAKIKDSHQTGLKVDVPKNQSLPVLVPSFFAEIADFVLPNLFSRIENKVPPLSARLALHAYNCVFRN